MDTPAHDPARLRRAWSLVKSGRVERVGPMQFKVAGNKERTYDVDLSVDPPCYCDDLWYRGRRIRNNCKHTLSARIANKEPAVLLSLIEIMQFKEEED